jgi:superfamily II DNA or RNA helicase
LIQEGYDDPNLTGIVIADPVSNPPRLKQMLGRVLRVSESKRTATVLDVCWRDWAKGCERRYKVYEEVGGEVRPLALQ